LFKTELLFLCQSKCKSCAYKSIHSLNKLCVPLSVSTGLQYDKEVGYIGCFSSNN